MEQDAPLAQPKKKNWIKITLLALGAIVFVLFLFFYLYKSNKSANSDPNTIPMYGFQSYEDYLTNRTDYQAQIDDTLVAESVKIASEQNKSDPATFASNYAVYAGFEKLGSGDFVTGIKRLNQGWLISHDNHNAYWGFAIWARNYKKDCTLAETYLNEALAKYNTKNEISKEDHAQLENDKVSLLSGCPS